MTQDKKNKIKDIATSLRKQHGARDSALKVEPEKPTKYLAVPESRSLAASALLRSLDIEEGSEMNIVITRLTNKLEEDASNFIRYCYIFLGLLECPGQARDLVLILLAMTRGDYTKWHSLKQTDIALFAGLSLSTIRSKLRALEDWEQAFKHTAIQIDKRDRLPGRVAFETTRFKCVIAEYVGEFMRRVSGMTPNPSFEERAFRNQAKGKLTSLKVAAAEEAPLLAGVSAYERTDEKAVAQGLARAMPKATPVSQRSNGNGHRARASVSFQGDAYGKIDRARSKMLDGFREYLRLLSEFGYDVPKDFEEELKPTLQSEVMKYRQQEDTE